MNHRLAKGFRVGEYTILPLLGQITGPSGASHLQPKIVDVLVCLAAAPGEVIEHERLLDEVWGDPDASHDALTHAISELRRCLDDRTVVPSYIQTIPKRGYRLIATVELLHPPFGNVPQPSDTTDFSSLSAFWSALKKRRVVRVSVAYAAISWLLLQIAEIVFDALAFPDYSMRVFVVVLATGFLLAVLIAWAYQVVPEEGDPADRTPTRLHQIVDIGIIAVLTLALGLLAYRQFVLKPVFVAESEPGIVSIDRNISEFSVAVLRFDNLGADARFSDGLSENLLHLLARIREISVPSRSTTWRMSRAQSDIVQIATQLRVRYVLEGSVQQDDEQIRVFAQLIDGQTGDHVWSENYDKELTADNFFSTQDDIALTVAQKIHSTLSDESRRAVERVRTSSLSALGEYLQGRQYLREPKTDETLSKAVEAFQRAMVSDPEYVEAVAGLCEALLAWYDFTRDDERFLSAERTCLRAAASDNTLGEVYAAMGNLYRIAGRYAEAEMNLAKALELLPETASILEELGRTYRAEKKLILAERAFERAIQAEPSSWSVYKSMGNFLFRTGRYKEAVPYYRQVITMEGDSSPGYNNLAVTYFMLGRFDDANAHWSHVLSGEPTRLTYLNYGNSLYYAGDYAQSAAIYEKALEMDANDHRVWGNLAQSLRFVPGRGDEAAPAWENAVRLAEENLAVNPKNTETLSHLATAYARLGKEELAERTLDRLTDLGWENPNTSFFVALTYHLIGQEEDSIRELERAVLMGFPATLIAWDPDFQSMSSNQRYIALLQSAESRPGT